MHDAPLEAHEHTEHLAHEGGHDRFVSRLAILVSGLAVLAAIAGNLEALETTKALATTGEATLSQDEATDAWGEYEADSIKRHIYTIAGDLNPSKAADYAKVAKEQNGKQASVRKRAVDAETTRSKLVAESRHHEERHHWLSAAATLFEVAIALSTVSIVTRKHWLWQSGAVLGVVGIVLAAMAFIL